jgi:hypothetical protein
LQQSIAINLNAGELSLYMYMLEYCHGLTTPNPLLLAATNLSQTTSRPFCEAPRYTKPRRTAIFSPFSSYSRLHLTRYRIPPRSSQWYPAFLLHISQIPFGILLLLLSADRSAPNYAPCNASPDETLFDCRIGTVENPPIKSKILKNTSYASWWALPSTFLPYMSTTANSSHFSPFY